jgi:hypothetical protein
MVAECVLAAGSKAAVAAAAFHSTAQHLRLNLLVLTSQALTVLPDGTGLQSQQKYSMCQPGFNAAEHAGQTKPTRTGLLDVCTPKHLLGKCFTEWCLLTCWG